MSREVRRVPTTFDWPTEKVWSGYLMPEELQALDCPACGGDGYSPEARALRDRWYGYVPFHPSERGSTPVTPETPEVRAFAERNVSRDPLYYGPGEAAVRREAQRLCGLWNAQWSHHLNQDDVNALAEACRLTDFTHTFTPGEGWHPKDPPVVPTAAEVNAWSLSGLGHDAINQWVVTRAEAERLGVSPTCPTCGGNGATYRDEEHRAAHDAWEPTAPPTGDGWQLWSTTTEGHPVSPVFPDADGLVDWMATHPCGFAGATFSRETAAKFMEIGWSPSLVGTPDGLVDGITAVTRSA